MNKVKSMKSLAGKGLKSTGLSSLFADRLRARDDKDGEWTVGGRYKALRHFDLLTDPWPESNKIGKVHQKEDTFLLELWQECNADQVPNPASPLYAYVASTRKPEWMAGWVQMGGSSGSTAVLGRQRQRGSWEVGGRYAVLGSPLLREFKELDSSQLGEVNMDEEVLVVELALVMLRGEPRLRGRVRTDSGLFGWLTVELPWAGPLLRPLNLYSEEAFRAPLLRSMTEINGRKSVKRLTLHGTLEDGSQPWEVGGKYRLLNKVPVYEDAHFSAQSRKIGYLNKGTLVEVVDKMEISKTMLHLKVVGAGKNAATGWIPTAGKSGKPVLDARDHTEYEKVMRLLVQEPLQPLQSPSTASSAKVPRLELESIKMDQDASHVPRLELEFLRGDDVTGSGEQIEMCTDSESEWSSDKPSNSGSEWSSDYGMLQENSQDHIMKRKSSAESNHGAKQVKSPGPVRNDSLDFGKDISYTPTSSLPPVTATAKVDGNNFVDARIPGVDDDAEYFVVQGSKAAVKTGCWLDCCGGATSSDQRVQTQVKTSGVAPRVSSSRNPDDHPALPSAGGHARAQSPRPQSPELKPSLRPQSPQLKPSRSVQWTASVLLADVQMKEPSAERSNGVPA